MPDPIPPIKFDPNAAKPKVPPPPKFSKTVIGAELKANCQTLLNYSYVFNAV
jgi:hypothetical protein